MTHNILIVLGMGLLCFSSAAEQNQADTPGSDDVGGEIPETEVRIYKQTPQGDLEMHLDFPPGWKQTDRRPAIVFFFGGAWRGGSVAQFRDQAQYLASRGLVTARAEYRIKGKHNTTADKCVEDCKSAVRWLRRNASDLGINPDMIAAGGGSAGGHTATATAVIQGLDAEGEDTSISCKPNLLVLFNPVMNTSDKADKAGSEEIARRISPNDHLTPDVPPAIIFFGTEDRLQDTAREYMEKAKQLGLTAELYMAEGASHGFFNRSPWKERTLFLADRFLAKYDYIAGEPTLDLPDGPQMKLEAASP